MLHQTELLLRFRAPRGTIVKATISGLNVVDQTLDVWYLKFLGNGLVELATRNSSATRTNRKGLLVEGIQVDREAHALILITHTMKYKIIIEQSEGELEQLYKDCAVIAAGGWLLSSQQ